MAPEDVVASWPEQRHRFAALYKFWLAASIKHRMLGKPYAIEQGMADTFRSHMKKDGFDVSTL